MSMADDLMEDLDSLRRQALWRGLGGYYPRYEGEIGTFDHLLSAPRRYLRELIELALEAFYEDE